MRLSNKEYRQVLAFFEKAVEEEPNKWAYWCDIGYCRGKLGQWREAAAALERVADKAEVTAAILSMLGHAYIKLERYREAEVVLAKARTLDPENVNILYKTAVVHFHCGDIALALSPLAQVIRKKPRHVKAQFSLGLIYHRLGNKAEAAKQLQIVSELDHTFAERLARVIHG